MAMERQSLLILTLTVGPFAENTYIVADPVSKEAFIIDAGDESSVILENIRQQGWKAKAILTTHGHIDHVAGAWEIQQALDIPFYIHKEDEFLLDNLPQAAAFFGLKPPKKPKITAYLEEGQEYILGEKVFQVFHVPGHSPGHVMFYTPSYAFVGDCIFQGSIGRTDLPGGSYPQLIQSIEQKIFSLPPETQLFSGHGPSSTVKTEMETNPFFNGKVFDL